MTQPNPLEVPISKQYPQHHAILDSFPRYHGPIKADFVANYLGGVIHKDFFVLDIPDVDRTAEGELPPFDEEYFEWVDILQSVLDAKDSYTIVELGAGFGRWGAIGVMAAKLKGIQNVQTILVEAEPQHIEWAHRHMVDNAILPSQYKLHEVAVGGKTGKTLFMVVQPNPSSANEQQEWYGQATAAAAGYTTPAAPDATKTYMGRPVLSYSNGWGGIEVEMVTIDAVLKDVDFVNMIDMDVQGSEADIIENGMVTLNKKVKRMHIGTHSHDVETRIRKVLSLHGWIKHLDYPCNTASKTPYGEISFQDGVQSWVNPRLQHSSNTVKAPSDMKLF